MKQTIFVLSLLAIVSCKENKQQETAEQPPIVEKHTDGMHEHSLDSIATVFDDAWLTEIQLNDGARWDANMETTEGVLKMQQLLKSQTTTSIEDYNGLAERLNAAKNTVVAKCTMKGPSHNNLHVWLVPLIEKIDLLLKTESIEEASRIKNSIAQSLEAYNNYFQ